MRVGKRGKWIGVGFVVVVAAAVTGGLLWLKAGRAPAQVVRFGSGADYRFIGVTYGTNHWQPTLAARIARWLPDRLARNISKGQGGQPYLKKPFVTPEPMLCVWFQPVGTGAVTHTGTLFEKLLDGNGNAGGTPGMIFPMPMTSPLAYSAVAPRRSFTLELCFYENDNQLHTSREVGRVRFPNPLFRKYPEWKAEPVPAVKMTGDVEVRLDNFATGVMVGGLPIRLADGSQAADYRPGSAGEDVLTIFDVRFKSPGGTDDGWVLQRAWLSDATGNVIDSAAMGSSTGGVGKQIGSPMFGVGPVRRSLYGTLWTDEAAWKLKLDIKRTAGFAPGELVTFKNVPLPTIGTTNHPAMTNVVGGVNLVLTEFSRNPDTTNRMLWKTSPPTTLKVEFPAGAEGVAVDWLKLTTDTGEQMELRSEGWDPGRRTGWFAFIPTNAQTVDITCVVQKTRSVEFMVKPPGK